MKQIRENKWRKRSAQLAFSLCLIAPVSNAQEKAESSPTTSNQIIESYKQYNNARYAVRWRVEANQLSDFIRRMPRYRYLTYYTVDGLVSGRGRVEVQFGFFRSQSDAESFVVENQSAFPGLRTVSVSPEEHQLVFAENSPSVYTLGPKDIYAQEDAVALLRRAKDAYANGQFQRSLELYSILSLLPEGENQLWARELVGLSLERLGRRNEAAQVYTHLLELDDGGAWVVRVKQRLRAIETAPLDGKKAMRRSKYENELKDFYWRGIVGQNYNYMSQGGKYLTERDTLDTLATFYDLTFGTTKWRGHQLETRLNGYDVMDMIEGGDSARTRIKRFYLSYTHTATGFNAVGGRQRDDNAGIYGYFDGASAKYPITERIHIGGKVGKPIRFTDFYDALDHKFVSIFSDYTINDQWFVSAYLTHQTVFSELDRAAYGGQVKYSGEKLSSFVNVDFDYEFAELNIFRWGGHYAYDSKNRFAVNYGRQRSPFLTGTNVKVGQPYLNLESYLSEAYNREYLLYNALQRTSVYEYGSISYSHKVDDKLQVTTDYYQSVSDNVPVFESEDGWITSSVLTYGAYRYSSIGVQAVALSFFGKNDAATMSYRFGDTTFATTNTLQFSERLKLGKYFSVNPKIGLRQSKNKETDNSQTRVRASLSATYKPWRNTEFRIEAGNEVIQDLEGKNTVDNTFIYAGYQTRF